MHQRVVVVLTVCAGTAHLLLAVATQMVGIQAVETGPNVFDDCGSLLDSELLKLPTFTQRMFVVAIAYRTA